MDGAEVVAAQVEVLQPMEFLQGGQVVRSGYSVVGQDQTGEVAGLREQVLVEPRDVAVAQVEALQVGELLGQQIPDLGYCQRILAQFQLDDVGVDTVAEDLGVDGVLQSTVVELEALETREVGEESLLEGVQSVAGHDELLERGHEREGVVADIAQVTVGHVEVLEGLEGVEQAHECVGEGIVRNVKLLELLKVLEGLGQPAQAAVAKRKLVQLGQVAQNGREVGGEHGVATEVEDAKLAGVAERLLREPVLEVAVGQVERLQVV